MDPRNANDYEADLLAWINYYMEDEAELAAHYKRQKYIDELKRATGVE